MPKIIIDDVECLYNIKDADLICDFKWEIKRYYRRNGEVSLTYLLCAKKKLLDQFNAKGRIPFHRIVAARKIGRPLTQDEVVDHINFNAADNRRNNLRVCKKHQNISHQRMHWDNSTGIKGVCFDKSRGKYIAKVCYKYKQINLGRFKTAKEAWRAYCRAAKEIFGEYYIHQPFPKNHDPPP